MLTLLFDGMAYGMLLFVLAVGLAVTLGLMNFINLAHGAFAMAGGYVAVLLMNRAGLPFLLCLPIAFVASAALGALLERTLYRPMYGRPHLDQVLFSIGLVFMAVTGVDYVVGSRQQTHAAGLAAGPLRLHGGRHRQVPALRDRAVRAAGLAAAGGAVAHALRQPAACGRRRPARRRAASGSTSTGSSSSPSRWARASRDWAARSAPRCSGSIRRFR